jgi:hypothetical protein
MTASMSSTTMPAGLMPDSPLEPDNADAMRKGYEGALAAEPPSP